jgi:hypothetical protein
MANASRLDDLPTDPLAILYLALRANHGLALQVSDVDEARKKFYKVRQEAADFQLTRLVLRTSQHKDYNLVILKKVD